MAPFVSVVIPTYNRQEYVAQAIESALEQEMRGEPPEVIVVDDGSTDDTRAVVRQFGARVTYLWQQNRREGAARNTGAAHARGTYLAFLDSDDYYLPGKLARDVERLAAADRPALVYSRARNVDPAGHELGVRLLPTPEGDLLWALVRESFVPLSTTVVRAEAFRACGGFSEELALSGTADWELWMRIAARWPVGFSDQANTCIRVHPRNMLSDPTWMERAMLAGVRLALGDPVVARRVGSASGRVRSHMYVTIALNAYGNGLRGRGLYWLGRAVREWPPQALDSRCLGAFARALLGPAAVAALRSGRPRRGQAGSAVAS